jgi:hypothetical protein
MSNDGKGVGSWQEVAAEPSRERDPKKFVDRLRQHKSSG